MVPALIALGAYLFTVPAWSGHTLTAGQEKALESWLELHTNFRVATDADCECSDDIQQMRAGGISEPVPSAGLACLGKANGGSQPLAKNTIPQHGDLGRGLEEDRQESARRPTDDGGDETGYRP